MDYTLKQGEVYNGGYSITIGSFTLRLITSYEPRYSNVYDTANTFTDYQGNTVKPLMGKQFSLSMKTGGMSVADYNSLVTELKKNTITVACPDFSGECICDEIAANLAQANSLNTRYTISFKLTAKSIITTDGL